MQTFCQTTNCFTNTQTIKQTRTRQICTMHTCRIYTHIHVIYVQRYMYNDTCTRIHVHAYTSHSRSWDMEIMTTLGWNVTLGLRPHVTFSTSGSSYFYVPLTTVRHLLNVIHVHAYMSYTYTHACTHVVYIQTLTHRTCTCHICTHVYSHLHIYMGKTCGFLHGAGTAARCSSRGKDDNLSRNKSQNEIKSTNNSPLDLSLRPHSQTSLIRKVWSET